MLTRDRIGSHLPRLCRLLNRAHPGGFGRKTIASIGKRWLPRGVLLQRVLVGNGFYMSLALDQYIDSAIYFDAFEYSTSRALARILGMGDTVIDVGANIGFFTLMACRLVGAEGRVVAFEPNSQVRRRLIENVDLNEYQDRVIVHDCGLSDANGFAELYVPTSDALGPACGSMKRQNGWDGYERESIVVKQLDDLWRRDHSVRLIKVDVEGAEWQVLRGAERLIRAQRPHVICEVNPTTSQAFGYDPSELVTFFLDRIGGYAVHALASRRIVYDVTLTDPLLGHPAVENWWFCPRDSSIGSS